MSNRRTTNILTLFLILTTLVLAALIFSDWLPWLRGPAPETPEWYWPHQIRPFSRWLPAVLAGVGMWGAAAWWLVQEKPSRARNVAALLSLIVASLLLQLALVYADRPDLPAELVDRTLSNLASGFFEPAAEIDAMGAALQNYPALMPTFASEHARTHPPGLIVANWLSVQAFTAVPNLSQKIAHAIWPLRCMDLWLLNRPAAVAAALGFWALLPLLAAALTVLPAFGLARHYYKGRSARLAAVLAATMPALLLFAPKSVQLYAPLGLLLVWLFHVGIIKRSWVRLLAAGVLLSGLSFLSFGNAALGLLLLLYGALLVWEQRQNNAAANAGPDWRGWATLLLAFGAGALSFWLIYWLGWGVAPWEIARVGLGQHYELVTNLRRYEWWLGWNLIDVVIWGGWPTALGFITGLILAIRSFLHKKAAAVDALAVSLLILILILNFSGSARGEVGRLWLFFMPLLAYPAAQFYQQKLSGKRSAILIVGLQLLLVVSLGLAWKPVRAVIVAAERPFLPAAAAEKQVDITYTNEPIQLGGYTLDLSQAQAGGQIGLTLFWEASGAAQRPYTVFVHLVDVNGNLIAQQDNWPVQGQWPPTCWRAADTIPDQVQLQLPENLPPGKYALLVGLYDAFNGQRLLNNLGSDSITLETLQFAE